MKSYTLLLLAGLYWTSTSVYPNPPGIRIAELERHIHDGIESRREANEAPRPLLLHAGLSRIARAHSRDMAQQAFFRHTNPGGQTVRDRLEAAGYTCRRRAGENIFQTTMRNRNTDRIASAVVDGWMQSPGHRRNILHPDYRWTGVGVAVASNGKIYVTQVFCG